MLHTAVSQNDVQKVQALLKKNTNVNEQDDRGQTPLHIASNEGNLDIVQELINHNADVNIQDKSKWTPLHCAVSSKQLDVIYTLLETPKVNVKIKTKDGTTMFHYLVRYVYPKSEEDKYYQVLDLSVHMGSDIHSPSETTLETPLHQAVGRGNITAIKFLLEKNVDINCRNKLGETPLSYAIRTENVEVLELLLACDSCDIHNVSKEGSMFEIASPKMKSILEGLNAKFSVHGLVENNNASNNIQQVPRLMPKRADTPIPSSNPITNHIRSTSPLPMPPPRTRPDDNTNNNNIKDSTVHNVSQNNNNNNNQTRRSVTPVPPPRRFDETSNQNNNNSNDNSSSFNKRSTAPLPLRGFEANNNNNPEMKNIAPPKAGLIPKKPFVPKQSENIDNFSQLSPAVDTLDVNQLKNYKQFLEDQLRLVEETLEKKL